LDVLAKEFEQNARIALVLARASGDMAARENLLNIAGRWVELAKARRALMDGSRKSELLRRVDQQASSLTFAPQRRA